MRRPFPSDRRIGPGLFLAALGLYAATMSRVAFPGYPARELRAHLGHELPLPILHLAWGWLVRLVDGLPGVPVGMGVNAFSALCAAACAGLVGWLMGRVRYRGLSVDMPPERFAQEAQARRISGCVAGLYLALCIPFWVGATRSLPATFHLLLLLLSASLFSQYQQEGRNRYLPVLGVLYGIGITEYSTFLLYLPVLVVLLFREMYRFGVAKTWRPHLLFWGGCLLGLSLYPLHVFALVRRTQELGGTAAFWPLGWQILREQFWGLVRIRFNTGFLALMFLAVVPWLMLFTLSRRSPWYYDTDQVLMRFVFAFGLLAVFFNAPFAFWNFLGVDYLMLTPHLLLAACMGFMAGEFWVLGGCRLPSDASRLRRLFRWVSRGLAVGLPVALMVGGVRNWRIVDARPAQRVHAIVQDTLNRLEGRPLVFTDGVLDELLGLAAHERRQPLQMINVQQMRSPVYLSHVSRRIRSKPLREALRGGRIDPFLDELLLGGDGCSQVAILDMTDVFRTYGHLVPDGLVYRLAENPVGAEWASLLEAQHPLWAQWAAAPLDRVPSNNLTRAYLDHIRFQLAKVANNLGVLQMEAGDPEAGALEAFEAALRIDPGNLSAWMNRLDVLRLRESPQVDAMEAEWSVRQDRLDGSRWGLSIRHGYLWNAAEWIRRGHAWALSGHPPTPAAHRRHRQGADLAALEHEQCLDQVYLRWGKPVPEELMLHARLVRDGRDVEALQELVWLSLRRRNASAAEAYLAEAVSLGLPDAVAAFDRVMIAYVRDGRETAWERLGTLTQENPSDLQAWLAQALWTDPRSPLNQRALRHMMDLHPDEPGIPLVLGWLHMRRYEWSQARTELETAVRIDSRNILGWELLMAWAQIQNNRPLAQICRRTLLEQVPDHPVLAIAEVTGQLQRSDRAAAELRLRDSLRQHRNPDLLYLLATSIMDQDGNLAEAQALLDEAILVRPFQDRYRLARAECHGRRGQFDEAVADIEAVRQALPGDIRLLWLEVRLQAARGELQRFREGARELARRRDELSPEQAQKFKDLISQMNSR
jgi:tetratricopeptide (TPR) repeat protein